MKVSLYQLLQPTQAGWVRRLLHKKYKVAIVLLLLIDRGKKPHGAGGGLDKDNSWQNKSQGLLVYSDCTCYHNELVTNS